MKNLALTKNSSHDNTPNNIKRKQTRGVLFPFQKYSHFRPYRFWSCSVRGKLNWSCDSRTYQCLTQSVDCENVQSLGGTLDPSERLDRDKCAIFGGCPRPRWKIGLQSALYPDERLDYKRAQSLGGALDSLHFAVWQIIFEADNFKTTTRANCDDKGEPEVL